MRCDHGTRFFVRSDHRAIRLVLHATEDKVFLVAPQRKQSSFRGWIPDDILACNAAVAKELGKDPSAGEAHAALLAVLEKEADRPWRSQEHTNAVDIKLGRLAHALREPALSPEREKISSAACGNCGVAAQFCDMRSTWAAEDPSGFRRYLTLGWRGGY